MTNFYQVNTIAFNLKLKLKKNHKNYLVYHQYPKRSSHNFVQTPTQKYSRTNHSFQQQYPRDNFHLKKA